MPKHWAALPRGLRWLIGGIAAATLTVIVAWILFIPVADMIANHDVGSITGQLRTLHLQTARDAARGRLLTLGAGLFAAGALVFTASNYRLARRTHELTEQGQVADRYTKAIEQLGSDKLDVRLGGIYALERVAHDSPRDHPTVMEVLAAFVREHSREPWPEAKPDAEEPKAEAETEESEYVTRPDVQTAITVIGRRVPSHDHRSVDLSHANLNGANFSHLNFAGAYLSFSTFIGATFMYTNLTDARLPEANLTNAAFFGANLTNANLEGVILTKTFFSGRGIFACADLRGVDLRDTDIADVDFSGVNLTGALLEESQPVPAGWLLDSSSGRLRPVS